MYIQKITNIKQLRDSIVMVFYVPVHSYQGGFEMIEKTEVPRVNHQPRHCEVL